MGGRGGRDGGRGAEGEGEEVAAQGAHVQMLREVRGRWRAGGEARRR